MLVFGSPPPPPPPNPPRPPTPHVPSALALHCLSARAMRPLCAMRLLWLLPFVTALLAQRTSYIDNTAPRRDAHGALMDVHDGNVAQWQPDGLFHWYGMGYRDCPLRHVLLPPQDCPGIWVPVSQNPCGFRLDHAVQLYTSPDLVEWTYRGDVLPPAVRPEGVRARGPAFHWTGRQPSEEPAPPPPPPKGTIVPPPPPLPSPRAVTRGCVK